MAEYKTHAELVATHQSLLDSYRDELDQKIQTSLQTLWQ